MHANKTGRHPARSIQKIIGYAILVAGWGGWLISL